VGSAPILRTLVFKISASMKFETVVNFLRKKLDCKPADSVFLYVNSVFAPGLDEGVGNLFRVGLSFSILPLLHLPQTLLVSVKMEERESVCTCVGGWVGPLC
jgi:hypothetical protein